MEWNRYTVKLSTRSRYGLRLMFELALNFKKGTVFLKDIAERQALSEKYLSKLIIPLRAAKLVTSARGAHGGYSLSRPPETITAREIVEVLEGELGPVECLKNASACDRSEFCPTQALWRDLAKAMAKVLDSHTLQSLVNKYDANKPQGAWNYNI